MRRSSTTSTPTPTSRRPSPSPSRTASKQISSSPATIDTPTARNWHLDVTSTNPTGVTNQEFINRAALGHQPGPEEHDPRNDVLTSAKRAEGRKHAKYDRICIITEGLYSLSPFVFVFLRPSSSRRVRRGFLKAVSGPESDSQGFESDDGSHTQSPRQGLACDANGRHDRLV